VNEVLLFTGGLDSYIARKYLMDHGHEIDCLYFDHRGKYSKVEVSYISKLSVPVIIKTDLVLKDLEQSSAFIPNRNILFSIMANSYGYSKIWIGGSRSDRVCDNNEKVFDRLSEFLSSMNQNHCKISSPFWDCYKDDMVRWYVNTSENKFKAKLELADQTFSCFNPTDDYTAMDILVDDTPVKRITRECLCCQACFRKCAVLYSANIFVNFFNTETVDHYYKDFSNALISTPRSIGTLAYIDKWRQVRK